MKISVIAALLILSFACVDKKKETVNERDSYKIQIQLSSPEFQYILDSADVKGSILIYDLQKNSYYSNDFEWANTGKLPASTYKIPNSIIAIETGVVENDSTLFKWNGEDRALNVWEQDLVFRDAFHFSCVPCYKDVARKIGVERMNTHLGKLSFGEMKVDATNIDLFWLEGESKVNQFEQIDFLKRFYQKKLPIGERTYEIMNRMMIIDRNNQFTLSGKTGWSIRNGNNNGWFVGYLEKNDNIFFFAANVEPKGDFSRTTFVPARKDVVFKTFRQMKIIK
jgi:beta-lactamase class D